MYHVTAICAIIKFPGKARRNQGAKAEKEAVSIPSTP
jgi:hypothetical protein